MISARVFRCDNDIIGNASGGVRRSSHTLIGPRGQIDSTADLPGISDQHIGVETGRHRGCNSTQQGLTRVNLRLDERLTIGIEARAGT